MVERSGQSGPKMAYMATFVFIFVVVSAIDDPFGTAAHAPWDAVQRTPKEECSLTAAGRGVVGETPDDVAMSAKRCPPTSTVPDLHHPREIMV